MEKYEQLLSRLQNGDSTLIELNFDDCYIDDDQDDNFIEKLAESLKFNTNLKKLYIALDIYDDKIINFFDALKINNTIEDLQILSHIKNYINEFIEMLKFNTSIKILDISNCGIDSYCVEIFAEYLKYDTNIKELYIGSNQNIDELDAITILNALIHNSCLKHLDTKYCDLISNYYNFYDFEELLSHNYVIKTINGYDVEKFLPEENRNLRHRFLTTKSAKK